MDSVIVGEFHHWEPSAPVGLPVFDEESEIHFEFLIDSFRLAVRLWMEGSGGVRGDVEQSV